MSRILRIFVVVVATVGLAGFLVVGGMLWDLMPQLPSVESLKEVRLQVPLRVYTREGQLVAEFGEKRRVPLGLGEIPRAMIEAVLAAEDERFFEHPGVDWQGLTRAVVHLLRTGHKGPGGSTITMQVARNFFLGREKTYLRKLNEILLALRIEGELSKEEILELYLNKIFLGHRAYGVGAAAQVYYGRALEELSLAEIAMIAGLPQAPSRLNPIVNPAGAVVRRNYVLERMRKLGFISESVYEVAVAAPVSAELHGLDVQVQAPYVAEMVRVEMESRLGAEAYTGGYRVYTTLDGRLQEAATRALRQGLLEYDERHGFRGPERQVKLPTSEAGWDELLADIPTVGGLVAALIVRVEGQRVSAYSRGQGEVTIPWEGLSWARPYVNENRRGSRPKRAGEILEVGDVVRLHRTAEGWRMVQVPAVEGALVAVDPQDGAVRALVGGFDFYRSKFNRVTQARRQAGSSFKPFIYSAAIEKGFTAASLINDAPVVFTDPSLEGDWRPENYSRQFFGPTRLREALTRSRNVVSIRLLHAVGIDYTLEYVERFGLDRGRLPRTLSLALGSGAVTPMELTRGYAVFANGGYRVEPYFVERIQSSGARVVFQAEPAGVCRDCEMGRGGEIPAGTVLVEGRGGRGVFPAAQPTASRGVVPTRAAARVITPQNAWLMNSMLRDVINRGTGRRARQLGRQDLAGKTGTTNAQRDAWFCGFTPRLVATAWVGFDELGSLGHRETGARAALPLWMAFMGEALQGAPEQFMEQPAGLVTVRIDPTTGHLVGRGDPNAIWETFRSDSVPKSLTEAATRLETAKTPNAERVTERLF